MSKARFAIVGLSIIILFLGMNVPAAITGSGTRDARGPESIRAADTQPVARFSIPSQDAGPAILPSSSDLQVTLSAPHTTVSWDVGEQGQPKFELPLLYLHRQREATPKAERTLDVTIAGLPARTEIQIEALSRHVDKSTGEQHRALTRTIAPGRACTADDPCTVRWTFDAGSTLSDLYTLRVMDAAGRLLWSNPHPDRPDFVLLDIWDLAIGEYTVRITYATLFPFAKGPDDYDNRLPPEQVSDFIENQFVPIVLDTWHTQFDEWGFGDPIHPDWDADKVVEIIMTAPPFALFDGTGTYTVFVDAQGNPFPQRRIWWYASNGSFQRYDSLENGCKVIYAHEFFHTAQWNVLLNTGNPTNFWLNVFVEAQGRLVQSVQYPELELQREHLVMDASNYVKRSANRFLSERMNTSYRDFEAHRLERYDAALYWRFLYERFNDMSVIRAGLEEMAYARKADIVASMGIVMDRTFARLDGPFQTFEQSLVAFARANYALRLEDGRCSSEDFAQCSERYYDPDRMYVEPTLEGNHHYRGTTMTYDGAIPASFGMDFLEISLAPALRGQPITVTFQSEGSISQFNVQIWELGRGATRPRALTPQPETVLHSQDSAPVSAVVHLDGTKCERLAVIITRLDADEAMDSAGEYRITLASPAGKLRVQTTDFVPREALDTDAEQSTIVGDGNVVW